MKLDSTMVKELHASFFEAMNSGSTLYVHANGDIYENWNYKGLLSGGTLDKPHLRFSLGGGKAQIVQFAQYHRDTTKEIEQYVLKEENELLAKIRKIVEAWGEEKSRQYDFAELF